MNSIFASQKGVAYFKSAATPFFYNSATVGHRKILIFRYSGLVGPKFLKFWLAGSSEGISYQLLIIWLRIIYNIQKALNGKKCQKAMNETTSQKSYEQL